MQQTIRRSIITTFSAFVLFGTGYVALARVADPVAPFNAVAQVHPVVGIAFKIFTYSGLLAFLVIVLGGLPILFTAIKHALPGGLRGVFTLFIIMPRRALKLFVASLLITICFLGFLLATEYIFRSPSSSCAPGGCIAAQPLLLIALSLIALTTLIVFILLAIITSLSQVVSRGEFSQPLLRFALFPITIITLIMACATIAVATWVASLWLLAPQFAASDAGLGNGQTAWVIAITLSMAIATALSALTLHNALHTP